MSIHLGVIIFAYLHMLNNQRNGEDKKIKWIIAFFIHFELILYLIVLIVRTIYSRSIISFFAIEHLQYSFLSHALP